MMVLSTTLMMLPYAASSEHLLEVTRYGRRVASVGGGLQAGLDGGQVDVAFACGSPFVIQRQKVGLDFIAVVR